MLGGEIIEAITQASALTYDDNKKFQDGLNCKSSMGKKKKTPWEQAMEALYKSTRGYSQENQRGIHKNKFENKTKRYTYSQSKLHLDCFGGGESLSSKLYSTTLSHRVGNLNKQLQHLLEHLHVWLKSQNMMLEDLASFDAIACQEHESQKQKWEGRQGKNRMKGI